RERRPFGMFCDPTLERCTPVRPVAHRRTRALRDDRPRPRGTSLRRNDAMRSAIPTAQGLYDPANEHDSCGVGFIVDLKGRRSHQIVRDGLTALVNLNHRGACGCENNTGDGAGVLIQIPHAFLKARCKALGIALPEPEHYGVGAFFTSPDEGP